jgi:restriction endonuclease S subunit
MTFNQSCYGLRGKENIDNGFLYYALKYEIEQFKNNASGAIFDAITTKTFDLIYIPIPPKKKQVKIIAEIEKMEKQIDEAKKLLKEVVSASDAIFKKYL